ncbi:MAG: ATPase [Sphingomonadales bacterium]|nr:ATPase [Sphingomonadales bacterium]
MGQIVLPLQLGPGGTPSRIVVGTANAAAVEALSQPANWPFRTAVLFAPARAGKSLLARWFVESGLGDAVDDADRADETDLFHRWNRAQERGVPLLLTASGEDGGWRIALPDLASRLGAALHLSIGVPDDAMIAELIAVHAESRGLALGLDGAAYLATRCERSHLAVERLVGTVDRLSLERKVAPGPAIWREALEVLAGPSEPKLL